MVKLIIRHTTSTKMGTLTTEQRVFIVQTCIQNQSIAVVQNAFRERFLGRNPTVKAQSWTTCVNIWMQEQALTFTKAVLESKEPHDLWTTSMPLEIFSTKIHTWVLASILFQFRPQVLTCRITKLGLGWHPYRMHVRHELLAGDFARRLYFSEWFNQHCRHERFLDNFIIGDEAAFSLNGEVNTHNDRQAGA